MAVSLDTLSQTILAIEDETSMALTRATPFISQVKSLGKVHEADGSYALRIPVEVQTPSDTTVLETGYETINMTSRDSTNYAQFPWGRLVKPIFISGKEQTENRGEYQMVKISETKYKSALNDLMRQINRVIVAGPTGLPTGFVDIGTLNGSTGSGVAAGFLEDAAIGSQTHVVGGLSKATYSTVPGWQNQFADCGASLASGVATTALRTVRTGAQLNRPLSSNDGRIFHTILATQDFYNAYEADLVANVRYIDQKSLDNGLYGLAFGDALVLPDPDMTTLQGTLGNGDVLAYALNLDGITLAIQTDSDFKFQPWVALPDQDVLQARILFEGGLIARNLGSCGIITY